MAGWIREGALATCRSAARWPA